MEINAAFPDTGLCYNDLLMVVVTIAIVCFFFILPVIMKLTCCVPLQILMNVHSLISVSMEPVTISQDCFDVNVTQGMNWTGLVATVQVKRLFKTRSL